MTIYNDEFDGIGGSYLLDPTTGKRTRIPEEGEVLPEVASPVISKKKIATPDPINTEGI